MRWFLGPSLLLLVGATALANCPTPVVVRKVVHTPVVVKEVVAVQAIVTPVAVYTPLTVVVPTYAAAYHPAPVVPVPAPTPPVAAGPSEDTKAIIAALKQFDARLAALEGRGSPRPPAPPAPMPPAGPDDPFNPAPAPVLPGPAPVPGPTATTTPAVFTARCAQCHMRGNEAKGGDFVMMEANGSMASLDARAILTVARRSYTGTMPPKSSRIPPLTDAEVAEVMAWLPPAQQKK